MRRFLSKLVALVKPSPMRQLMREICAAGFVKEFRALELFAREGNWHTLDYLKYVRSLDAWEIDPAYEANLRKNLPSAEVRITDSFAELRSTTKKFNFVISDNSMALYGDDRYCEHFDLFPEIFRILEDSSILILNVIPSVKKRWQRRFPHVLNGEHCERRSRFYSTDHPKDLSIEEMVNVYRRLAEKSGFSILKTLSVKRSCVHYLALFLVRSDR